MGLENIEKLEGIGEFTLRAGKKKGGHVLEVAVSDADSLKALSAVSQYLSGQPGVKVQSINYIAEGSKVVVDYSDVKKGASNARGSTGCGSSMFTPYSGR